MSNIGWLKNKERGLARRAFLGTMGTVIALPVLESLIPKSARAAENGFPKRLLYYFVPNGIHMPSWRPATTGADWAITPILKPLEALKSDIMIVSGLDNTPARPDGAGDHAAGTAGFITCAHALKSSTTFKLGISADQIAAKANGMKTRVASLQLGSDGGALAGGCDSGYGCPYARAISWSSETTPLPMITVPKTAFDLLFAGFKPQETSADQAKRQLYKKSVLDVATAEANSLANRLGRSDKRKLEEYLGGVREVERQVSAMGSGGSCMVGTGVEPVTSMTLEPFLKTMSDIMVLAMQCDVTRIITYMFGNAVSGRTYPVLGATRGHHDISHHGNNAANQKLLEAISTYEMTQVSYLLTKMKATPEGDQNLLYNSTMYLSSDISDGNRHNHDDMPVLVAGHGGGMLKAGHHIDFPVAAKTKVANALLSTLLTVGVNNVTLGDGTGPLPEMLKT
ncbi:MAG TPA: DUF1552 domain-containing protein [Polyangia bacterium]